MLERDRATYSHEQRVFVCDPMKDDIADDLE